MDNNKITKKAEWMTQLRSMVTKEATAGTATGKPGADTHYTSVSKETEHVDKNKEGHPEHNPQEFKQEPANDKSDPSKTHSGEAKEAAVKPNMPSTDVKVEPKKEDATNEVEQFKAKKAEDAIPVTATSSELAKLGSQLLAAIESIKTAEASKQSNAGTATGKPGADTHYTSVSKDTEHVDKNKEGHPEHNPQEFKQEPAKDKSDPSKTHKSDKKAEAQTQEELDKQASFELGRQFCREFLQTKVASQNEIYKQAGRRDFEALIAQAAAELEQEDVRQSQVAKTKVAAVVDDSAALEKQAEEAGAAAFQDMLKQAQVAHQAEQVQAQYNTKIAELNKKAEVAEAARAELAAKLAAHELAAQKKAEEDKLDMKLAAFGGRLVDEVITRLKHESAPSR